MVPFVSFVFNGVVGHCSPCFQWFSMVGSVMVSFWFSIVFNDRCWSWCPLFSFVFNGMVGHGSPCFSMAFNGGVGDACPACGWSSRHECWRTPLSRRTAASRRLFFLIPATSGVLSKPSGYLCSQRDACLAGGMLV